MLEYLGISVDMADALAAGLLVLILVAAQLIGLCLIEEGIEDSHR